MSAVRNIGRVNMASQWMDTLLNFTSRRSSGSGSSISPKRPCGAISFAISAQARASVCVENT